MYYPILSNSNDINSLPSKLSHNYFWGESVVEPRVPACKAGILAFWVFSPACHNFRQVSIQRNSFTKDILRKALSLKVLSKNVISVLNIQQENKQEHYQFDALRKNTMLEAQIQSPEHKVPQAPSEESAKQLIRTAQPSPGMA